MLILQLIALSLSFILFFLFMHKYANYRVRAAENYLCQGALIARIFR